MNKITICLILFLISCSSNQSKKITATYGEVKMNKNGESSFLVWKSFKINDTSVLSYFSNINRALVITNINQTYKVIIPVSRPIKQYITHYIHNLDSIFIFSDYGMDIVNSKGLILDSIQINEIVQLKGKKVSLIRDFSNISNVYFSPRNKELYFRSYSQELGFWDLDFYSVPVDVRFNLNKKSFEFADVKYPKKYREKSFGYINGVNRTFNADKNIMVYSFGADEKLYEWNISNNSVKKLSVPSQYSQEEIQDFNPNYKEDNNLLFNHMVVNDIYLDIKYDPYKKIYYRFMYKAIQPKNDNGIYNTYYDKPLVIAILDENLKLINELNLGVGFAWNHYFITENGLYLRKQKSKSNEYENYHHIAVHFN